MKSGSTQFTKNCFNIRIRSDVSHSVESAVLLSGFLGWRSQHCRPVHLISHIFHNEYTLRFDLEGDEDTNSPGKARWDFLIPNPHKSAFLPLIARLCWKAEKLWSCSAVPGDQRNPFSALRKTIFLQFSQLFMVYLSFFFIPQTQQLVKECLNCH